MTKEILSKDTILLFILLFLLFFLLDFDTCSKIIGQGFDSQMLLTWQYTLEKGYRPIFDLFYPYGFFQYFKDSNLVLSMTQILLKVILYSSLFVAFKTLYSGRFLPLAAFLSISSFIVLITTVSVFSRYGILLAFSMFVGLALFKGYGQRNIFNFFVGIVVGLIFYILPDQAFLAIISYIALLFFNFSKSIIRSLLYFLFGIFISLIPFFAFLLLTQNFSLYLNSYAILKDVSVFAKIPFPPGIFTNDNVLTIATLIFSIAVLSYRLFVLRLKKTKYDAALFAVVIPLILLEQKNVLRSIDTQLVFYAVVLVIVHISRFCDKRKGFLPIIYLFVATVFLVFFAGFKSNGSDVKVLNSNTCIEENLRGSDYLVHKKVLQRINALGGGIIFSYPQDPVFYVLSNQQVPYFLSVYEASTIRGQKIREKYIKDMRVEFVIINMDVKSTQDNVPDFVRAKYETSHIFNNYESVETVENFLILKKSDNTDFFNSNKLPQEYAQNLLNVNLELIPKAEARDKSKYLRKKIYSVVGLKELNEKLSSSGLSTVGKQMLVKTLKNGELILTFETNDGNTTIVRMLDCSKGCLVNLNGIPLFYRNRVIRDIASNLNLSEVTFFEEKNSIFW